MSGKNSYMTSALVDLLIVIINRPQKNSLGKIFVGNSLYERISYRGSFGATPSAQVGPLTQMNLQRLGCIKRTNEQSTFLSAPDVFAHLAAV